MSEYRSPETYIFTADSLEVCDDPPEIQLSEGNGLPRGNEFLLGLERVDTGREVFVQLYAELHEPTDFYPDGVAQWPGSVCRDGVERLVLAPGNLDIRFSDGADVSVRGQAPPVRTVLPVRTLRIRFADPGGTWLQRLEAGLQRLCQASDSYRYRAASRYRAGGGTVTFELSDARRESQRRAAEQTARDQRLLDAVSQGDLAGVRAAVEAGARPDAGRGEGYGMTALAVAAGQGNTDVVRLLLDLGADINALDVFEATALIRAAEVGKTDVVRLLLERGAETGVNARELDFGHHTGTALDEARRRGYTDIVALLAESGGRTGSDA